MCRPLPRAIWKSSQYCLPSAAFGGRRAAHRRELAQCFARLGSKVTDVDMAPRLLTKEYPTPELVPPFSARRNHAVSLPQRRAFENMSTTAPSLSPSRAQPTRSKFAFAYLAALGRRPRINAPTEELGVEASPTKQWHHRARSLPAHQHPTSILRRCRRPYQFTQVRVPSGLYERTALFGGPFYYNGPVRIARHSWTTFPIRRSPGGLSED